MSEDKEKIAEHKRRNREMFDAIAQRYDLLNHLLSGGIDIYWRRRALDSLRVERPQRILDLATGTGDFALSAGRLEPQRVFGVDVALEMLRLGVQKVKARDAQATLLGGDAEYLPFRDGSFDVVMGAFGVRNFGHIPSGLAEAYRVLKPGGEILVLDFCEPAVPIFKQLYLFYFHKVLPLVGGIISGERQAYAYLPRSVGDFPQGEAFVRLLDEAGFVESEATPLTMGICSIYQGLKPLS
ncbi:MAG: demethylmenaquinone methyltransferase/2-methoxy-6-polyprenyl-1,4-benzoquinol methylase [Candidatus Latescibacterota bacterium]|jgi:demethylmenaquinone methyltransferase / 2-methoxy-6-polyprenyl-1,4-benzoquinol methylase